MVAVLANFNIGTTAQSITPSLSLWDAAFYKMAQIRRDPSNSICVLNPDFGSEYSNEEPGAVIAHAGFCAGAVEQSAHPTVTTTCGGDRWPSWPQLIERILDHEEKPSFNYWFSYFSNNIFGFFNR